LQGRIARLENGLEKLKTTAVQVEELKVVLAEQEIELSVRNIAADKLIQVWIAFIIIYNVTLLIKTFQHSQD
jgi:hypothetical protein